MDDDIVKKMALIVAANCLISEDENHLNNQFLSEKLNKQVVNRLYTYLLYLLNKPSNEYASLMEALAKNLPQGWDMPELDKKFINFVADAPKQQSYTLT